MPERLTVCKTTEEATFKVLSLKLAASVRMPVFCGVKVKLSEQLAPGANVNVPQVEAGPEFSAKLVVEVEPTEPDSGWLPTF